MKKRAGKMSGVKFPGVIQLESQMEAALVRCMQVDPRVVSLKPQPCTIDMGTGRAFANKEAALEAYEGRRYRPKLYTPDLEVKLVDGRLFYLDAKHSAHIDKKTCSASSMKPAEAVWSIWLHSRHKNESDGSLIRTLRAIWIADFAPDPQTDWDLT